MKFYPFSKTFNRSRLVCRHCKKTFTDDAEKEELFLEYNKRKDTFVLMHTRQYKNFSVNCGPVGKFLVGKVADEEY